MLRFVPYIILIIVLDQITKFLIVQNFDLYASYQIFPFLKIIYLQNEGAAFSFLNDAGGWQRYFLILVSVIAVCILPYLIKKNLSNRIVSFALMFILAGAFGNLVDRVLFGYVIDFIYFHYQQYYWPAFNVADAAISFGVFLLFLDIYQGWREQKKH
jgi:signal peptidase II